MALTRHLTLAIVALAVAVIAVSAWSLESGLRHPGDRLACNGRVDIRAVPNRIVSAQRICQLSANKRITQVRALDRGYDGRGGYPSIVAGGSGYKYVTLKLRSQQSQPLNFTLQVYAKPSL